MVLMTMGQQKDTLHFVPIAPGQNALLQLSWGQPSAGSPCSATVSNVTQPDKSCGDKDGKLDCSLEKSDASASTKFTADLRLASDPAKRLVYNQAGGFIEVVSDPAGTNDFTVHAAPASFSRWPERADSACAPRLPACVAVRVQLPQRCAACW